MIKETPIHETCAIIAFITIIIAFYTYFSGKTIHLPLCLGLVASILCLQNVGFYVLSTKINIIKRFLESKNIKDQK